MSRRSKGAALCLAAMAAPVALAFLSSADPGRTAKTLLGIIACFASFLAFICGSRMIERSL